MSALADKVVEWDKIFQVVYSALGVGLAVVRAGVLLALLLGPLADRGGRRRFVAAIVLGIVVMTTKD